MEIIMKTALTFKKQLNRLILSCGVATVMFAGGFSLENAKADDLPAWGEGVVITPASAQPYDQMEVAGPKFKRGKIVPFGMQKVPGSIVVDTHKNVLYLVLGDGQALQYRVATAKPGFEWTGTHKVSGKVQWPDWRPPVEMRKRRPELPAYMAGGPKNPLGARAMYLGSSIYRIHGTNEPTSIGKSASSGCIRMLNADVEELYLHVKVGATVTVL
jgi:lipoprotein-anchoring transpeptidase ErfK/SrfK